jgi:hypothetical protein
VVWQKRTVCSSMSRMMRLLLSIGELLPTSFGISWDLEFVFALAKNLFWWIDLCVCVCVFAVYCILTLSSFLEKKNSQQGFLEKSFFLMLMNISTTVLVAKLPHTYSYFAKTPITRNSNNSVSHLIWVGTTSIDGLGPFLSSMPFLIRPAKGWYPRSSVPFGVRGSID